MKSWLILSISATWKDKDRLWRYQGGGYHWTRVSEHQGWGGG
jgi:hypothetical protein